MSIAELLPPGELAALERMLDGDDQLRLRLLRLYVEHGVDVRDLDIVIRGGRVRMTGDVPDELTRLTIEDLAWSLDGVAQCDASLRVVGLRPAACVGF